MRYRIIGFNDEVQKYHGPCTRFRDFDCYECEVLPSQEELRSYATYCGYLPRSGRGISQTLCQPVYLMLDPAEPKPCAT